MKYVVEAGVGVMLGGGARGAASAARAQQEAGAACVRTVPQHALRRARAPTHEDRGPNPRGGGAPAARRPETRKTTLLVHSPDRYGHPPLSQQAAHPQRDLRVPSAAVPVLPQLVSRLEELGAPQPQPERVLRQVAEGARPAGEGALLDDRSVVRVYV